MGGDNDDRPGAWAYVAASPGIRSCRARRSGGTQHATLQGTEGARRTKHAAGVVADRKLPHDPAENLHEVGLGAHVLHGGPIVHDRLQSGSSFGEHVHDLL